MFVFVWLFCALCAAIAEPFQKELSCNGRRIIFSQMYVGVCECVSVQTHNNAVGRRKPQNWNCTTTLSILSLSLSLLCSLTSLTFSLSLFLVLSHASVISFTATQKVY